MKFYRKELEEKINASGHYYRLHFPEEKHLTYVGVLINFFEPEDDSAMQYARRTNMDKYVRQDWDIEGDTDTVVDYINVYVNTILPEIDRFKALESYSREDFDSIMDRIKKKKPDVEIERIKRFEMLLLRVYKVGVANGLFEDMINTEGLPNQEDFSEKSEDAVRILLRPKSLSLAHERNILKEFKESDICEMKGERLAAFLQFFTGARNEEVTGVCYGDFKDLSASGRTVLYLFKTSRGSKGRLSLEMKTSNARRIVPVFSFLANRIGKRRAYIENLFPGEDISKFRVACRGDDYSRPMNPRVLTESGKQLILDTVPEKGGESALTRMLARLQVEGVPVEEKSPTAYLFRRNFATHLHNLGLEQSVMEAIIGHELIDPEDSRHHFASEDALEKIHDAFAFHPFNVFFPEDSYENRNETSRGNRITISMKPGIHYQLLLNEPNDETVLELEESRRKDISFSLSTRNGIDEGVDISGLVNKSYAESP